MVNQQPTPDEGTLDLGTFEGYNFARQAAITKILTAEQVIHWDHDKNGESEFWPSGDRPEVLRLFNRASVTASELAALHRLLTGLGDDSTETFLKIHYAVNINGADLADVTVEQIEDLNVHVFLGMNLIDLRRDAAYELFELYYPEEYRVWEKSLCDGLTFDTDGFLDSPSFFTEELALGDTKALLVAPQ